MKNYNSSPDTFPEREFATEMRDGDQLDLHMADPRLKPVPTTQEAREEVLAITETQKKVEIPPHHISREVTRGIIRLRVISQQEALGAPASQSWDNFEVTR